MFPDASDLFAPMIFVLSVVAVIYTSFGCVGAERHEKIDRIFIGRPYGFRDNWHLQHE